MSTSLPNARSSIKTALLMVAASILSCLSLPSLAFNFDFLISNDIEVSHVNGIFVEATGNTLEFTSGDQISSITFASGIFNVSFLSPTTILVSDFDATGISINGGGGTLNIEGGSSGGGGSGGASGATLVASGVGIDSFGFGGLLPGSLGLLVGGGNSPPVSPDALVGFIAPASFGGPTLVVSGVDFSIIDAPVITFLDAKESLVSTSSAGGLVMSSISTVLNGAHSRPLSRLVDKGEKTGWAAGDWGVDHHDSRHGDLGLAEVGMGYHFGFAQINLALGKTWSDQDTLLGGSIEADGKFVMVEGIIPVAGIDGLHATVTGYRHWGDVDLERGYINAGTPDFSTASPDSRTWGLRARLDWQNAFSWRNADYTPYVDLSYSDSHLDSFTEVGGAFPAFFDDKDEEITELRLGVNGELPLFSDRVRLLGNLEAAHRFDDDGSRTSGQLIGLFSFDLPGTDYDQNWFKAGIGVEGNLGKGKASLMINGTTEGEMPSAWAAFAYQVRF